MKLPENHVVCELCKEIIPIEGSKKFVASYSWGSFSGTPKYGVCCKIHVTDQNDHPMGEYMRPYA